MLRLEDPTNPKVCDEDDNSNCGAEELENLLDEDSCEVDWDILDGGIVCDDERDGVCIDDELFAEEDTEIFVNTLSCDDE
jgi:hypothetical protein